MTDINRRKFNTLLASGVITVPVVSLFGGRSHAQELVDPESANAQGLQFALESPEAGKQCSGCMLYSPQDEATGTCSIFTGKLVPEKGWCTAYTPKPA